MLGGTVGSEVVKQLSRDASSYSIKAGVHSIENENETGEESQPEPGNETSEPTLITDDDSSSTVANFLKIFGISSTA